MILREYGLQHASFPLDWVGNSEILSGEGVRLTTDVVVGGFRNWLSECNLEREPRYDSHKHLGYFDRGTRLFFIHDFSIAADSRQEYLAVRSKYLRRIERFQRLLSSAHSVLFVWIADPRSSGVVSEDDIQYSLGRFRDAYPNADFKMVVANCAPGIRPEAMQVRCGDGYECYAFDYRAVSEGAQNWEVRNELFAPIFKRCAVVDYRTREEKRANASRVRARDMEKFKATSTLDLLLTKMKFKLYRHLKRKLEQKGVLGGGERQ